ncbi:YceI family protein [Hymenobacter jeollabukensis]|uniref:YceI family protein n=1 Tax=Hymenobacter jeollabukensis TaxID=2025313 RepID=A0A5R8WLI0_9BACT|nr:YceI family protein [Hymenobacter jeollabukensis]TLM90083.1 YceI family protein [Hymenobacter jeollabukensis]
MKNLASLLLVLTGLSGAAAQAQTKFQTQAATISFFSSTPIEDIAAKSLRASALVDAGTGRLAFSVPIRSFTFRNGLMQEHFNENYLDSDKYPKATFAGTLLNWSAATLAAPGPHPVQVEGNLTIHGVTRRVRVPGTLEQQGNRLLLNARFSVQPADYRIDIPALVRDHIAKTVEVNVAAGCVAAP